VKDAAGTVLGELVSGYGGLFMVRSAQGVLLNYGQNDGALMGASTGLGTALFYVAANCSGTPLGVGSVEKWGLINDGDLYALAAPYQKNITWHSRRDGETGACSVEQDTGNVMTATLIGAAPGDAVLPLKLE
jgi:hypothetical protein